MIDQNKVHFVSYTAAYPFPHLYMMMYLDWLVWMEQADLLRVLVEEEQNQEEA